MPVKMADIQVAVWVDRYSLVLITLYNLADFISRYFPLVYLWDSRKGLFIACLSRSLFIPCFYFTAKYADAGWMIFLCIALGLTGGYLTASVFLTAPRGYNVCNPLIGLNLLDCRTE
jgi:equilibrative nucleoside transporter 1/2/3